MRKGSPIMAIKSLGDTQVRYMKEVCSMCRDTGVQDNGQPCDCRYHINPIFIPADLFTKESRKKECLMKNAITLELLIKSYHDPDVDLSKYTSTSGKEAIAYLHKMELWMNNEITEKGRIHVLALINAPLPVATYTSPLSKLNGGAI